MAKEKATEPAKGMPASTTQASLFPLNVLRGDIDHAFERMFRDWPRFGGLMGRDFFNNGDTWSRETAVAPRVDVSEDDKAYEIAAEMPGVEEKNIEVTVKENRLTLKGEKKSEKEEKKKDYHMTERSYGSFERSFQLPEDIEADKISAEFANGVLKVMLPKSAQAKTKERKVSIKAK